MIEIHDAIGLIKQNCEPLAEVTCDLSDAPGHVLSSAVISPDDSPPFDKSMMDGYAVRAEDIGSGSTRLRILDRITAGNRSQCSLEAGTAIQIMTGAPVPLGSTAVVPVEETDESRVGVHEYVDVRLAHCSKDQNILRRAKVMARGDEVMAAGQVIRRPDIGVLAEIGLSTCRVIPRPSVAILATGDELVHCGQVPGESQIRNSNGPMLHSLCQPYCRAANDLGIAPDDLATLKHLIQQGLTHDVLILTGGVSAGVADLVPQVLRQANVEEVFHKVRIKPGKPLWFGVRSSDEGRKRLVFALPGNPVSSLVGFCVFVAPALSLLSGRMEAERRLARLTQHHEQRPGRTTYWPSRVLQGPADADVTPLDWRGSADLKTLVQANCLAVFPGESSSFSAGDQVEVLPLDV